MQRPVSLVDYDVVNTSSSSSTSLSLIERAQAQDLDAWQRMSNLFAPIVYRWARQAGLQDCDASDVVQDVFRALVEHISDYRQSGRFRSYLYSITRNKIRDHFQKVRKSPQATGGTTADGALAQLSEDLSAEEAVALDARIVRQALNLLETDFQQRTWRAFWMQAVEDMTAAEVCERLQMSPAAVYQAKSRVLRRLRDEFAGMID